jgi:hypothetical protein
MGLSRNPIEKGETMAATKSRATRAAEKAQQDQAKPELCIHDLDPAACAECNGTAAAQREAEAQPEPKPELPTAALDLGKGRINYYWPALTVDGESIDCPHAQWGHGSEKTAMACARKMAADRGVKLGAPES